jgi:16S rRNA A1518/A1519 N6-dimethyltransferase RsmA/KsgA/DIM1 with predicted DNA glycosylase/AP lyase activity
MANERITEDIVRNHFKADPLFKSIKFEEQKSYNKRVVGLLQSASKSGTGVGKPEFIISFPAGNIDYLLVVECKANVADHRSAKLDNPKSFAVDGVLRYAKALSAEFDVVAIAVSGQTEQELLASHFIWKKGEDRPTESKADKKLLSINSYLKLFNNEQFADNLRSVDIIQKAIFLNEEYQAYSITEMTRCTMVSAILLSLLHEPFRISYKTYATSESLGKAMLSAIESVLSQNEILHKDAMIGEYGKILNEPIFKQKTIKHKNKKEHENSVEVAKEMVAYLHGNVYPLVDMEQSGFDVLGRFYTEFIRYAGSEQSQGLVLTPFHITDLFCDLASLGAGDVIYDPCCGTGGFLIAGMKRMFELAGSDEDKQLSIKNRQLVGVELRPSMYTYACSNMMMRGDGKSNIYCGDCFALENIVKGRHKPTVAFLNPPYDVGTTGQLLFIEHALNMVSEQSGTVVAIVQMSCAIKNERALIAAKKRILEKHRLKAVLSMPDELFNPNASVVSCVMVFKANEKHEGKKTWFGYFKNDGFEKRKQRGRIDARGKWKNIKDEWLAAYHNADEIAGLSVKQEVRGEDEWCAEAYMKTDYATLNHAAIERKVKDYLAYKFLNSANIKTISLPAVQENDVQKMPLVKLGDIFEVKQGKSLELINCEETENGVCFVSRTSTNNGVAARVKELYDVEPMPPKAITVALSGSVLSSFYQEEPFYTAFHIACLYPKATLSQEEMLYYCAIIEHNKYRYNFGRQANKTLKNILVPLIK